MRKLLLALVFIFNIVLTHAQQLASTPPMGFMSWNYFETDISAKKLKAIVDAMVANGMVEAGYRYICIDDGWQGGRDSRNNIIADPKKFPKGMKAFVAYAHRKGMKVGIYSDASKLTCGGYTGSLHFEKQDAKTFASWGIDYLKYDYCGAPTDVETAKTRYKKMAEALKNSGKEIVFAVCEWGQRQPWLWAADAGGQLWRTTYDIRDKWINESDLKNAEGIMDIFEINAGLSKYAGPGHWNDPDMLVVGLYGKDGPSGDRGGNGCTDVEYQSQMSLWCLMAAPLMISCDVRNMNEATRHILMNKDIIAIDQDPLGKQAIRKINNDTWTVLIKPLSTGDYAIGVLNKSHKTQRFNMKLSELDLNGKFNGIDIWSKETTNKIKKLKFDVASHETKVIRLNNSISLK